MADRISDEHFEAMSLSQQLEFVGAHLHDADKNSFAELDNMDVETMLMHCLCMARTAKAMEAEILRRRDDEMLNILRLEISFEESMNPDSNILGWPVVRRSAADIAANSDLPKGAA